MANILHLTSKKTEMEIFSFLVLFQKQSFGNCRVNKSVTFNFLNTHIRLPSMQFASWKSTVYAHPHKQLPPTSHTTPRLHKNKSLNIGIQFHFSTIWRKIMNIFRVCCCCCCNYLRREKIKRRKHFHCTLDVLKFVNIFSTELHRHHYHSKQYEPFLVVR